MSKRQGEGQVIADAQPLKRTGVISAFSSIFSVLHLDLLVHVFGFLLLRPRLRAVSRVCKRWRIAVLRSVDQLPPLSFEANAQAVALFFNLSRLQFALSRTGVLPPGDFPLPRDLRALRILSTDCLGDACVQSRFTDATSLTALSIGMACKHSPNLLAAASLTSLQISYSPVLASLHLPALCDLELIDSAHTAGSAAFLARHASQLTALSTCVLDLRDDTAHHLSFPRLRQLCLSAPFRESANGLKPGAERWLAGTPSVPTHVRLGAFSDLSQYCAEEYAYITDLTLALGADAPNSTLYYIESLSALPCSAVLASLDIVVLSDLPRTPELGSLPALTSLRTSTLLDLADVLPQLLNLELRTYVPNLTVIGYLRQSKKLRTLVTQGESYKCPYLEQLIRCCEESNVETVCVRNSMRGLSIPVSDWLKWVSN